ncbi:MAG TPA: terminase [Gammaproteobacteria bacterium]|nr:terminase [Gammaproteobacteria bacterium]
MNEGVNRDQMSFSELLAWAWSETPPVHRNRSNLILHLVAVPLFVLGHLLLTAAFVVDWWVALDALSLIVVSLVLQAIGHRLEPQQVAAFTGPRDFVRRLYAEQFCNFWRFLFAGQWLAHLSASSKRL